jgi:hypothetical protein
MRACHAYLYHSVADPGPRVVSLQPVSSAQFRQLQRLHNYSLCQLRQLRSATRTVNIFICSAYVEVEDAAGRGGGHSPASSKICDQHMCAHGVPHI